MFIKLNGYSNETGVRILNEENKSKPKFSYDSKGAPLVIASVKIDLLPKHNFIAKTRVNSQILIE